MDFLKVNGAKPKIYCRAGRGALGGRWQVSVPTPSTNNYTDEQRHLERKAGAWGWRGPGGSLQHSARPSWYFSPNLLRGGLRHTLKCLTAAATAAGPAQRAKRLAQQGLKQASCAQSTFVPLRVD